MSNSSKSGCLGFLIAPFIKNRPADAVKVDEPLPYAKRDDFLSAAEISFFHVLQTILSDELYLLTKVNLADLFFVKRPHENKGARGRISQKHVDFVICNKQTMEPLCAVELDDRSHEKESRKQRDAFVDRVFGAAELPILHIPAAKGYVTHEIQALISELLHPSAEIASAPIQQIQEVTEQPPEPVKNEANLDDSTPMCPKCYTEMIQRTASKGKNAGNTFWGCSNYPKCRHTLGL